MPFNDEKLKDDEEYVGGDSPLVGFAKGFLGFKAEKPSKRKKALKKALDEGAGKITYSTTAEDSNAGGYA